VSLDVERLAGWTPIRISWSGEQPGVEWCWTEGASFTEPFFDQSVQSCLREPYRLLFRHQTGMDELEAFVAAHPGLPPAGFIFHLSRSGSTLVSQMLAALPQHAVISEAGPIDALLRWRLVHPAVSEAEQLRWLRLMVSALGQPRTERQRRLFVKFDAWATPQLGLVSRAFPEVPWVFVCRHPVEVLASHARRAGAHMIAGALPPALFGLDPQAVVAMGMGEYGARVLAAILRSALAQRHDPLGRFVDHGELPAAVLDQLAAHWSLRLTEVDRGRMAAVALRDAKNPALDYEDDRQAKQREASPELRALAERWLAPLYTQVSATRRAPRSASPC
jgi:hypothetical protein